MARNGSGTYSKVNTFVASNTITAAGHNQNWDDIATEMTNSVAADGQTTITAALKGFAGTVSAPGYSFSSDLDSGMYRIGANNVGLAVNGAKVLDIGTAGLGVTGTLTASSTITATSAAVVAGTTVTAGTLVLAGDGAVGAPAYTFTSDTDCGLYRIGANDIAIAVNGTKVQEWSTTQVTVTGGFTATGGLIVSSGSVSLPAGSVANAALAVPPAMVKISTGTISGGVITFSSGIDSTYRAYKLIIEQLVPANDGVTIFVEISQSASFKTSGYLAAVNAASGSGTAQASATANIPISQATDVDAGATTVGLSGEVTLFSPGSTTMKKHITALTTYLNAAATSVITVTSSGYYNTDTAAIDGIRIKSSGAGGLSTGQATLYGLT